MRHLFDMLVETITERITGIESEAITLLELPTYLEVSRNVTICCNIMIVLVIVVFVFGLIGLGKFCETAVERLNGYSEKD